MAITDKEKQIAKLEAKYAETATKYEELGEEIQKLKAMPEEGERWRAEANGTYYYCSSFKSFETQEDYMDMDNMNHLTGNYFKTEKEAKALGALEKHIYSLPSPKIGDPYHLIETDFSEWTYFCMCVVESRALAEYHAGTAMADGTTHAQRAKRTKLLKAVYGA